MTQSVIADGRYLEQDGRPAVQFVRIYPHAIERIWHVITDADESEHWFPSRVEMERHEGGYYIRLMARDLAGTAATIATRLAEQKISIESIVQRHPDGRRDGTGVAGNASPVPVILITYATSEDAVHRALRAVQADQVIRGRPQVIRIEKN